MKIIKHGKTKKMKVCDIKPLDGNYVIHSDDQIKKLKNFMERVGYRSKMGVGGDNVCYFGNGRLSALMQINPQMTIEVEDLSDLNERECLEVSVNDNSLRSVDIDDKKLYNTLEKVYTNINDNIANIQETMNIDMTHIVKKMDEEMDSRQPEKLPQTKTAAGKQQELDDFLANKDEQKPDPRPQRGASTKLAKIILEYTRDDFDKVKELSEKASTKYGVTSTSDLFLKMLEANA